MKTAVLIDGAYWGMVCKAYTPVKVRVENLAHAMAEKSELVVCNYYNCMPFPEDSHYNKALDFYSKIGSTPKFNVKLGKLKRLANGRNVQKGVDTAIAVDMMTLAYEGQVDHIAMLTGDADFAPAIYKCQEKGLKVTLWCNTPRNGDTSLSLELRTLIGQENLRLLNVKAMMWLENEHQREKQAA